MLKTGHAASLGATEIRQDKSFAKFESSMKSEMEEYKMRLEGKSKKGKK